MTLAKVASQQLTAQQYQLTGWLGVIAGVLAVGVLLWTTFTSKPIGKKDWYLAGSGGLIVGTVVAAYGFMALDSVAGS